MRYVVIKQHTHLHVPAAGVDPNAEVFRPASRYSVVDLDVLAEQLLVIDALSLHAGYHRLRTEETEACVVELDVPAAMLVQIMDLLAECLNYISEVFRYEDNDCLVCTPGTRRGKHAYRHSYTRHGRRCARSRERNASTSAGIW